MDIKIHINAKLAHQVDHGKRFVSGFAKHGIKVTVTGDVYAPADIHVISGCWYAKKQWIGHPKVVYLDRCYYRGNPEHVSIGWMRADGGRDYHTGTGRLPPVPAQRKTGSRKIFLADYDGPQYFEADEIRYHPARKKMADSLEDALKRNDIAIGYQTTTLVSAALAGLKTICLDDRNIMARKDWLDVLPYADWHLDEIENGDVWEFLND